MTLKLSLSAVWNIDLYISSKGLNPNFPSADYCFPHILFIFPIWLHQLKFMLSGAGFVRTDCGHLPVHQDLLVRNLPLGHSPTSEAASCRHLAPSSSPRTTYATPLTCSWCDKLCVLACVTVQCLLVSVTLWWWWYDGANLLSPTSLALLSP